MINWFRGGENRWAAWPTWSDCITKESFAEFEFTTTTSATEGCNHEQGCKCEHCCPEIYDEVDMVNHPPHYQLLPGVEVYDVRVALLKKIPEDTPFNQVSDWDRATEYLMRMWNKNKNKLEDAKKARWYLDKLIADMEGDPQ